MIRAAVAAGLLVAGVAEVAAAPEIFQVEAEASSAEFSVSHFGVFKQRGRFGGTQGTIVLDAEQRSGSVELVIVATSIDTGWHARDEWLRGEEMFDVAHYPVVQFRSTKLVFDEARLTAIAGLLTLHGVTRPIVLKVERMECGSETGVHEGCDASAVSTIRRSQFGMDYALGLVSDEVELSLQVSTHRRPQ